MRQAAIFEPKIPPLVEAFRFMGWQNAEEFHKWFPNAFYVGRGYEHYLRRDSEKDRSRGDTLEDAPPYLVLPSGSARGIRVDVGQWVVQHSHPSGGRIEIVNDSDFLNKYKPVIDEKEINKNG
jgi:hypothetical protein